MFTLAHLSDPHLGPMPQPHWTQLIGKRLTGYLNWQRGRDRIHDMPTLAAIVSDMKASAPDHVAVTGDIANIALPEEYLRGRDWLESLGSARDVSFVPGNHDIYVRGAVDNVTRQWGAQMRDDDGTLGFPFVRRRGNVAIIGVNTGVPTLPFMATGWIGTQQMLALQAILVALKREGLFRVVLIHHPPVSAKARHKCLLDAQVFMRVIKDVGAELVLHGHDHIQTLNWLAGPDGRVPAVGVPSASGASNAGKHPAAYNLYRIDGESGAWRCEAISRGFQKDGSVVEELQRKSLSASALR